MSPGSPYWMADRKEGEMSYPEPRYRGTTGESSATFRPVNQSIDVTIGHDTAMQYLATGASTRGQFGLYRSDAQPHTRGPNAHFHRTISESFFILSGTLRLFNGERWIDAKAGDFFYVPEGGIHGFHNESDEPGSLLLLFAPGAPREGYFEAIAEKAAGRQFSDEEWAELCRRHDNYFI